MAQAGHHNRAAEFRRLAPAARESVQTGDSSELPERSPPADRVHLLRAAQLLCRQIEEAAAAVRMGAIAAWFLQCDKLFAGVKQLILDSVSDAFKQPSSPVADSMQLQIHRFQSCKDVLLSQTMSHLDNADKRIKATLPDMMLHILSMRWMIATTQRIS